MKPPVILLVEDDADDEALTLRALRDCGLPNDMVVVRTGPEALDYLAGTGAYAGRDATDLPQAILLDLHLPGMDGLELLRRLRADRRTEAVPVIILTGSGADFEEISAYSLGANAYASKPLRFDAGAMSDRLGLYWLLRNQALPGLRERPESKG